MKFITLPTYELTLPSTSEVIKYRPYVTKEEKILVMALESREDREIKQAVGDIVSACTFGKVDVDKNPLFDVQYIFLQLRIKSVGEISEILVTCPRCEHQQPHFVNLEEVKVHYPGGQNTELDIGGVSVKMRYPTAETLLRIKNAETIDETFRAIAAHIVSITTEEEVHYNTPDTEQDFVEFAENLTPIDYQKIRDFFTMTPSVNHSFSWLCAGKSEDGEPCGQENYQYIDGLYNFFL